jgi:GNAT superfamily N-acetyltransferase
VADVSVRPAGPGDAAALGEVQARAWRSSYAGVLPAEALAALEPADLARSWQAALAAPPSPRHAVLAACAADVVAGFAAVAPAEDADLDPAVDAELTVLVVDPARQRQGHASRLLAATVDRLRGDGARTLCCWVAAADDALPQFLGTTGWSPDGATRSLDLRGDGEVLLRQVRLHTDVTADPAQRAQ